MREARFVLSFIALISVAQPILAKPVNLSVQVGPSQSVQMDRGSQIVTSVMPGSVVIMRTPNPAEGRRIKIAFYFVNTSKISLDIGPDDIIATPFTLVPFDVLMAEQRSNERSDHIVAGLSALGNSLAASGSGGYRYGTTSYGGYVDCGVGCNATYSGSAATRTYDPYLAQQAQARAEAVNSANIAAMEAKNAGERASIEANLRTTTLIPGQELGTFLTFDIPRKLRKSKTAQPFTIYLNVGADTHVISGHLGPIGVRLPSGSNSPVQAQIGPNSRVTDTPNRQQTLPGLAPRSSPELTRPSATTQARTTPEVDAYTNLVNSAINQAIAQGRCKSAREIALRSSGTFSSEAIRNCKEPEYPDRPTVRDSVRPKLGGIGPRLITTSPLLTPSDYPILAANELRTGKTGFRAYIGEDGRVYDCTITYSSGHNDLDEVTCWAVRERARFEPAVDLNGAPRDGYYSSSVNWILSEP